MIGTWSLRLSKYKVRIDIGNRTHIIWATLHFLMVKYEGDDVPESRTGSGDKDCETGKRAAAGVNEQGYGFEGGDGDLK